MNNEALLGKAIDAAQRAVQHPRFTPRPEDEGAGFSARLRRLYRYRGAYLGHVIREARERARFPKGKDFTATTFWGRVLTLPGGDADARFLATYGTLGGDEDRLIRFLIRILRPGDIFYDIGANYGFYTALAQELVGDGEVHSFEPNSVVFPYLARLKQPGTFLNSIALAETPGPVPFFSGSPSDVSGFSTTVRDIGAAHHFAETIAEATSLDAYALQHTKPTIIKMDVEGGEAAVLRGGKELLASGAPTLAVELRSGGPWVEHSRATLEVLAALGYTPSFITKEGEQEPTTAAFLTAWLAVEHAEMNFIFTKP